MIKAPTVISVAALLGLIISCGGGGDGTPTGPAATGNLLVTVAHADTVPALVHISGPNGYSHDVSTTTTLTGLPVGSYSITADSSTKPDTIVGAKVFSPLIMRSPVSVTKDATNQVTVAFTPHSRGMLWIADYNEVLGGVGVSQLRTDSAVYAETKDVFVVPSGIAIDGQGVMWVSSLYDDTLREYSIAQRSVSGVIVPTAKLESDSLGIPEQIAFDHNGTLWVSDHLKGLFGFTAAQLAAAGHGITPAYHLTDTASSNPGMESVAIDADGNARVAEHLANQVVEFTAAQLTHSGSVAPAVRFTASAFRGPVDVAFDSRDILWVASELAEVYGFTRLERQIGGTLRPSFTVPAPAPAGIAFDQSGSMWATSSLHADVEVFKSSTLTSISPEQVETLMPAFDLGYINPGKLAFDPWVSARPLTAGSVHYSIAKKSMASRRSR